MAVRYSGDAEVRMHVASGRIYGSVRDPVVLWRGSVPTSPFRNVSDDYDHAAKVLLERAEDWAKRRGRKLALERKWSGIVVRRLFQAPCPVTIAEADSDRRRERRRQGRRKSRG